MNYVDYWFYTGTYKGDKVGEDDFPHLSLVADGYLNMITGGKITTADNDVKMAVCSVIDTIHEHDNSKITGRSVGQISESYASEQGKVSLYEAVYQAVYPWLINTGLLYQGVGYHV